MASQLKVDTITGVTTAGSIAVTAEGNSTTTNLQQGLCKVWLSYDQATNSLIDSLNTASMTDTSTGKYAGNWTNNFGNATYMATENTASDGAAYGNYGASSHNSWHRLNSQRTTSLCQGATYYTDSGSGVYADFKTIEGMFMGDLA